MTDLRIPYVPPKPADPNPPTPSRGELPPVEMVPVIIESATPPAPTSAPLYTAGKVLNELASVLFFGTVVLGNLLPLYPKVLWLTALSAMVGAGFKAICYYIDLRAKGPGNGN